MKTTDYYYGNGLTREEYETDKAQLDGFSPVECDWQELFRWVMSCGQKITYRDTEEQTAGVTDLWFNHVLTVLIEITRKNTREYRKSFIEGRGTAQQPDYMDDLSRKINQWINRLEHYLLERRKEGNTQAEPFIQAASLIKKRLTDSLPKDHIQDNLQTSRMAGKDIYYDMLNALKDIRREYPRYIEMIESDSKMDGSLSLLLTYIRNYCRIVEPFNRMVRTLPGFYRGQVLQVTPQETIQDKTFLVLSPAENTQGFILPANTAFNAGTTDDATDLVYSTSREEHITSIKLEEIHSVFLKKADHRTIGVYKQAFDLSNAQVPTPLFPDDRHLPDLVCGWMIESAMLILEEGKRTVEIDFMLTGENASHQVPKDIHPEENGFSVWLSGADGWVREAHREKINDNQSITFSFTLGKDRAAPVPCIREIHHIETRYPSVRVLMENNTCPYDWASEICFSTVLIRADVKEIRNFNFYNELGEIDTSLPFYPFGTRAEQGAWFMLGNKEMGQKHLEQICLKGKWKQLPPAGYAEIYKTYPSHPPITDESFSIRTEFRKDKEWHSCTDPSRRLFQKNGTKLKEETEIIFEPSPDNDFSTFHRTMEPFGKQKYSHYGYFRATLQEPAIGFGLEAYRTLFTTVMIHNSREKEKKQIPLPAAPIIPMLADAELSYKAYDILKLADVQNSGIRLSRVTPLSEYETYPIDAGESQPLLPKVESGHQLYWSFTGTAGTGTTRIYLNLSFTENNLASRDPEITAAPLLVWEYLKGNKWNLLQPTAMVRDETNGFTQAGFIEIHLSQMTDETSGGKYRIRTLFQGDTSPCLALSDAWTNCIQVIATHGDGKPLPAGTIQTMREKDGRVESVSQPLDGFGGKPGETPSGTSVRQTYRVENRHRAVLPKDYESLLLEQFPEVEKANCYSFPGQNTSLEVKVMVFCRTERVPYFFTPAWKLAEIRKYLSAYTSPFVSLQVINPVYLSVDIACTARIKSVKADKEKIKSQLEFITRNYLAPWIREGTLPPPEQAYSYQEIHSRIANHEDILRMEQLTVNGKSQDSRENLLPPAEFPWVIPVPGQISIILLPPTDGVGEKEIGNDFKIG